MQGQKESPPDMQCKDKFLLQSVVAPDGTTTKDINSDMVGWLLCIFLCLFLIKDGSEESDEGSSPSRPSVFENGDQDTSLLDAVSKSLEEPKEKSSEDVGTVKLCAFSFFWFLFLAGKAFALRAIYRTWSMISRLTEEKLLPCLQQNQKLRHALLAMESYEKETWLDLRDVNQEFDSLEKSKMGVQGIRKAVMS
ncbi:hypothetical protein POTOM_046378 [Populus tomentosa]|uniref:Uncharacterized protein n=1 Tax=Populus tomentosa TaxID=118781 RepID=A0A8X8CDW7_POPTO|nr:hypothetical protein POTOM_046378 [Populus tomentosa]